MARNQTDARSTRTLSPRDALAAGSRRNLRVAGDSRSLLPSQPPAIENGIKRLDPRVSARVAARAVIDGELRQVAQCIDAAGDASRESADRLEALHIARRGLKRLQALRSLLRDGIGGGNAAARQSLRQAKGSLASTRQHDALAILLEELCSLKGCPLLTDRGGFGRTHLAPTEEALAGARGALSNTRNSMRVVAGAPIDWHDVAVRLGSGWDRARRVARAQWMGKSESWFHQSRKEFQRLADQMAAARDCMSKHRYQARSMLRSAADQLGRARDLGLLAETIDTSTRQGRMLAHRAETLRTSAVRKARRLSRRALDAPSASITRDIAAKVARRSRRSSARD